MDAGQFFKYFGVQHRGRVMLEAAGVGQHQLFDPTNGFFPALRQLVTAQHAFFAG